LQKTIKRESHDLMKLRRARAGRMLLYEKSFKLDRTARWLFDHMPPKFLDARFVVKSILTKGLAHKFTVRDLFNANSKQFSVQRAGIRINSLHFLRNQFGILVEDTGNAHSRQWIALVHLDWANGTFVKLQMFEYEPHVFVYVDKADSSKFVIARWDCSRMVNILEFCELAGDEIEFGATREIEWGPYDFCVNGRLFDLRVPGPACKKIRAYTYDLNNGLDEEFLTEALPNNVRFPFHYRCEWMHDRLFVGVKFNSNNEFGIASLDLHSLQFTIMAFAIDLPIKHLQFVDDNFLMVYAQDLVDEFCVKRKIYKIAMRKPDSLRNNAWNVLVRVMKDRRAPIPHAAARTYLPFNSEIRSPFDQ